MDYAVARKKIMHGTLSLCATAIVVFFVGRQLLDSIVRTPVNSMSWSFMAIFVSFCSYCLFMVLLATAWCILAGIPFNARNCGIYFVTSLGKYVPGKIWTAISKEHFFPTSLRPRIRQSGILEIFITFFAGSTWAALGVFYNSQSFFMNESLIQALWWACGFIITSWLVLPIPKYTSLSQFIAKLHVEVPLSSVLFAYSVNLLAWFFGGNALFALISSQAISHTYFYTLSSFALAYVLGYIAFLLPAGIGVREQTLLVLFHGSAYISIIILMYRTLTVVTDMLLALLGLVFIKWKQAS